MIERSGFAAFWMQYPRKDAKGPAEKAYVKAIRRGTNPADIEAGAKLYAANVSRERTESRYVTMPAKWLEEGRWNDESLRIASVPSHRNGGRRRSPVDIGREIAAEMRGHHDTPVTIIDMEAIHE